MKLFNRYRRIREFWCDCFFKVSSLQCHTVHEPPTDHLVPPVFTLRLVFCVLFQLSRIKSEALIAAVLRAASMTREHPWLVVLRRQRSCFTLFILTILCRSGVAKQP